MNGIRVINLFLTSIIMCGYCGCSLSQPVRRADVLIVVDKDWHRVNTSINVDDQGKAQRLKEFFPHAGEKRRSIVYGQWQSQLTVEFILLDGTRLRVDSNFDSWTEGFGDWPAKPGLKEFVIEVAKEGQTTVVPLSGGFTVQNP